MRRHHGLVCALVLTCSLAPLSSSHAGNADERRQNREEEREDSAERAEDAADRTHVETLYLAFSDARASNDYEALDHVDHRVQAYLGAQLAEADREVDRARREVRDDKREIRSDRSEIRDNRRDDADGRDRADDQRDRRDDKRDLRDDRRDADDEVAHFNRLKKIEAEWSGLMGTQSHKTLNRKHSLLLSLRGLEYAEAKRNRSEAREDEAERGEDRRERREDRREGRSRS